MKTTEQIQARIDVLIKNIDKRYGNKTGTGINICKALDHEIKELQTLQWVLTPQYTRAQKIFIDYFKIREGKEPTNEFVEEAKKEIEALEKALKQNEIT